eukprot:TRINITY_DN19452_c0_g1_i1.p2 TRINITY_DN19452_c0_g1~~TRINITY_DN19452_c0_g1_i1.p2  ORF type:complete len:249 (-),score=48.85 TRINITY_DN19452_c0_g1_i1:38-784(-)
MEKPLYYEGGAGVSRRALALGHTMMLAAVFFPPFVLCLSLSGADISYFVGRGWMIALAIVPLLLLVPFLHMWIRPKKWPFYLFSVLIPAVVFACVAGVIRVRSDTAHNALMQRDCFVMKEQMTLHRAYMAAMDFYIPCATQWQLQGYSTPTINQCAHYEVFAKDYPQEMHYLQNMEMRFPCAGICRNGRRIFDKPGNPAPACGLFVAQWLEGASVHASIVIWYVILTTIVAIPSFFVFVSPIVNSCER